MNYTELTPKVIGKMFKEKKFEPRNIFDSLRRETDIGIETAKRITDNVSRFLITNDIKLITPPLIREIVNIELLKFGKEKERLQYTRIGFPFYDLKKLLLKYNGMTYFDMEFINKVFGGVLKEFKDVEKLVEDR